MSVGGIDILLVAPAQECIADLILRVCQYHWRGHECVFQDADDAAIHSLADRWVWEFGTASREFFVYQDKAAASSWQSQGAVRTNQNRMFHFLLSGPIPEEPDFVEVTLVCDRLSQDVKRFVANLRSAFLASMAESNSREAA